MFYRLLVLAAIAVSLQGADLDGPSGFYVVSVFFSDNGPHSYYRLIEVRPDGPDSLVRYARVAPAGIYCPRKIVQLVEARVCGKSPAELVAHNNPCAVNSATLRTAMRKYGQTTGTFEATSFGIVAQCGDSTVSFALPDLHRLNVNMMKTSEPALLGLWSLSSQIADELFGANDVFHDRSDEDDRTQQQAGAKFVPTLTSGRYDAGLTLARDNGESRFGTLLTDYHGPIPAAVVRSSTVPELLNASRYRFSRYVAPTNPPLARQARIQGKVVLRLIVDSSTGAVRDVSVVSGHPLLAYAVTEAARQWVLATDSVNVLRQNVVVEFSLTCRE